MILTHGANSLVRSIPIPEILFASDDFVTIHTGELLESNITSEDTHYFALDPYSTTPFGDGVLDTLSLYAAWNSNKRYCLFSDKTVSIKAPLTQLNEFSLQFYYMSDSDCGRFHYGNPYTEIFSVYNDNSKVTLINLGSNKESFNGASIGTGPWSTDQTSCYYNSLGTGLVIFISMVFKRISDDDWRQYFYCNGTLYFSSIKRIGTDNISISHTKHNPSSSRNCHLAEVILFSYSRASQDMMTYPTNNYMPMY